VGVGVRRLVRHVLRLTTGLDPDRADGWLLDEVARAGRENPSRYLRPGGVLRLRDVVDSFDVLRRR
jgi:hypothetical protein